MDCGWVKGLTRIFTDDTDQEQATVKPRLARGFLDRAAHDEAVSSFGRNDNSFEAVVTEDQAGFFGVHFLRAGGGGSVAGGGAMVDSVSSAVAGVEVTGWVEAADFGCHFLRSVAGAVVGLGAG